MCELQSAKTPSQAIKEIGRLIFRQEHGYPPELIMNMDEMPMYFDMVPGRTVSKRGAREV